MSRSKEFLKMIEEVDMERAQDLYHSMINMIDVNVEPHDKSKAIAFFKNSNDEDKALIMNVLCSTSDSPISKEELVPAPAADDNKPAENNANDSEITEADKKEVDADLEDEKMPFIQVMNKVQNLIDKKPTNTKGDIYKLLLSKLVKEVEGPAMVNRQLTIGLRNFWKLLQSGQYKNEIK